MNLRGKNDTYTQNMYCCLKVHAFPGSINQKQYCVKETVNKSCTFIIIPLNPFEKKKYIY